MAYRIRKRESVCDAVRRIATEQIDRAIGEVEDSGLGQVDTVHQVRKRCKKIRGLIRLVRPAFPKTYRRENAWYRDAAALLSDIRNAESSVECLDRLLNHFRCSTDAGEFAEVRERLIERRRTAVRDDSDSGAGQRLGEFRDRMQIGRKRVQSWKIPGNDWKVVSGGLLLSYRRGRELMSDAFTHPTAVDFHEWRKRVKDHWYHTRILEPIWDDMLKPRSKCLSRLADDLGDDHDLALLRALLLERPNEFGGDATLRPLIALIDTRQNALRAGAHCLGLRLFAEKPKHLKRRFRVYWDVWRHARKPHSGVVGESQLVPASGSTQH